MEKEKKREGQTQKRRDSKDEGKGRESHWKTKTYADKLTNTQKKIEKTRRR